MEPNSKTESPKDYLPDDALNSTEQPENSRAEAKWNPVICVECGWHTHSEHHLNYKHEQIDLKNEQDIDKTGNGAI